MQSIDSNWIVIGISVILILSYLFNRLAKSFNIPSFLLLMATGIVIKLIGGSTIEQINLLPILEVIGIIGLIMIVLEASMDLELSRENWPILWRSFMVAVVILLFSSLFIAFILKFFLEMDNRTALIYAVPLSIMSSAVIIPSVMQLTKQKRDFMICEATFSDILGIIFFYFLIDNYEVSKISTMMQDFSIKVILTFIVSILISYGMVYLFQRIKTPVKYVLMLAVLILLYSIGKSFHLSALLTILIFGLVINNKSLFFRGIFKRLIFVDSFEELLRDFKIVVIESAFVVRTFFFVIFGMSIVFVGFGSIRIFIITALILGVLYTIRYLNLKFFLRTSIYPELFIAPRGLITILLFFAIPAKIAHPNFDQNIILLTILSTSVIMMVGLLAKGKRVSDVEDNHIRMEEPHDSVQESFPEEPAD